MGSEKEGRYSIAIFVIIIKVLVKRGEICEISNAGHVEKLPKQSGISTREESHIKIHHYAT